MDNNTLDNSNINSLKRKRDECSICKYDIKNDRASFKLKNCGHVFHLECIKEHLSASIDDINSLPCTCINSKTE